MMANNIGISVIICCYNSASRLPNTLAFIANQHSVICPWEVIIVDNASTDQTAAVAKLEWSKYKVSSDFTVVEQPIAGLNAARQKGISISRYEYLLFCDDDNWMHEDFLSIAYQIMKENTQIGILGGQSEAVADVDLPEWFSSKSIVFAVGKQAASSGVLLMRDQSLFGACMVLRKSVWNLLYSNGFDFLSKDRLRNNLSSGGDTELGKAVRLTRYQIYYEEKLRFKHYIPDNRANWHYFLNLGRGTAMSSVILFVYDSFLKYRKLNRNTFILLYLIKVLTLSLKLIKRPRILTRYIFKKNVEGDLEIFEVMRLLVSLGAFLREIKFALFCFEQVEKLNSNIIQNFNS